MTATVSDDLLASVFHSGAPVWQRLADTQPEFVAAYARYAQTSTQRNALPPDKRELLQLATDASLTALDPRAIEDRMRAALAAGASPDEVLHVLMLVSFCSVHTLSSGLPAALGHLNPEVDEQRAEGGRRLREKYHGERAYWRAFDALFPGFHDQLAALAPDLFEAYQQLGLSMWNVKGGLEPKWCELVFVAMDLSTTHLYLDGARLHLANAVHYGATLDEVVATVALAAAQGARTIVVGAPILWKLLEERR